MFITAKFYLLAKSTKDLSNYYAFTVVLVELMKLLITLRKDLKIKELKYISMINYDPTIQTNQILLKLKIKTYSQFLATLMKLKK